LAGFCVACGGTGTSEPAAGSEAAGAAAGAAAAVPGATASAPEAKKPAAPTHREVTLPAGTTLRLELKSAVASDTSKVEDAVRASLRQAVVVDGQTVLPAGTELAGVVTDVEESGRVKGRAHVAYRFDSLRYDDEKYTIATEAIAHEAAPTKKQDAKKIGIGAGVGAALGAVIGGGSGAAKGAAIGGAAGTGAVLATKGDEVRRGPGDDVSTTLTAPLTVRVKI